MIATLSGGTSVNDITVTLGFSGTASTGDYSPTSGAIVIPAGSTTGTVTVNALQDLL